MATDRTRKKLGKGRHRSALKRQRQNETRRVRNRSTRSALKTAVKAVRANATPEALTKALPFIDKAVAKGIIPKRRGSRIIARLAKFVKMSKSKATTSARPA